MHQDNLLLYLIVILLTSHVNSNRNRNTAVISKLSWIFNWNNDPDMEDPESMAGAAGRVVISDPKSLKIDRMILLNVCRWLIL